MNVITIGGATQDIFLTCQSNDQLTITENNYLSRYLIFNPQNKTEASKINFLTGGGATNSAATFKKMNFDVSCFCSVADDFAGSFIKQELKDLSISTDLIITTNKNTTGTSVIINNPDGDRILITYRGANNELTNTKELQQKLPSTDIVYITSISEAFFDHLSPIAEAAKKNKTLVSLNPGKNQLTASALPELKKALLSTTILIMNFTEAKLLTTALITSDNQYKNSLSTSMQHIACATTMSDEEPYLIDHPIPHENLFFNIRSFFKEVLKLGPSIIVITNGCNGVYVATHSTIYFHPSMKVPVVNTVGAGDSFGATFVGIYGLTQNIERALKHGIVNSASVLQDIGAKKGLLSQEEQISLVESLNTALLQQFPL